MAYCKGNAHTCMKGSVPWPALKKDELVPKCCCPSLDGDKGVCNPQDDIVGAHQKSSAGVAARSRLVCP